MPHKPRWDPLGITPDGSGGANVALWAEGAERVEFCVLRDRGEERRDLRERTNHVFHDHVDDLPPGTRYGFRVHGPWEPDRGLRWNPAKLLIDPYARALTGALALDPRVRDSTDDGQREMGDSAGVVPHSVVVADTFDWGHDRHPETPWTDTVIYEAHVRGLTLRHPEVPAELRGTYAGVAHPAVISHLQSIGITAIELLPIHHFVSELPLLQRNLTNYWGYNSIGYFAPHAGYSSRGSHGGQVEDFKTMVKDLHHAGIEVILDVVYNHTAEGGTDGPTLSFRGIDNPGYYRLGDDGCTYIDYTACGNSLNIAQPHVLQMVMDSLRYWVQEMHVDGFRFDLASTLARSFHDVDMLGSFMSAISQDPILRTVKLIAEPWDIGPGGYQVGEFPVLWAEWNDKYRDALRSYWRGTGSVSELARRITGSADLYQDTNKRPQSSINYVTAHDGFTLHDLMSFDHKHNLANGEDNRDGTDNNLSANCGHEGETDDPTINAIRRRQVRNFLTSLFLSTGVPMLCAGDEIGRTQRGNNNAYCQDNEISWVDWELAPWQQELHDFTASVALLRREHQVFRRHTFFDGRPVTEHGRKDVMWLSPSGVEMEDHDWQGDGSHAMTMWLSGDVHAHDTYRPWTDETFVLLLNGTEGDVFFHLPGKPMADGYSRVLDTASGHVHAEPSIEENRVLRVPSRSVTVLLAHHGAPTAG